MNILIWVLSVGIVLFQLMDYWTTSRVLERGGMELNGVMRSLFDLFGRRVGLAIGKLYAAVFFLCGAYFGWFESKIGFVLLLALFALYAAVVANNLVQFNKTR